MQSPSSAGDDKVAGGGTVPSHGISIDLPNQSQNARPLAVSHVSAPAYSSPLRHHRRESSRHKPVKETFNAKSHYGSSSDDGGSVHQINQYIIKQEIGRGSFGSVHLAVDQYGTEFAIKEFSKSRLRKRAQSNLLRRPSRKKKGSTALTSSGGFNVPLHRQSSGDRSEADSNAFDLIKGEIAVMKKLDHPNIVSLIEVLDDPDEDSLYMVLEMCKKGVVMKVGLEETADPYDDETCRYWFRDMAMGLEYLHAQGIIHRDLKPDNCLITSNDVLKIVDFGVSEMFDKETEMTTSKSAGSPAFMPPELCVARHGNVSGRAVDIWSMGVTLYCLRFGRIPFEKQGMLELYEAIKSDSPSFDGEQDARFVDLMSRMLEKDPEKRIKMHEIREHPWVTKNGEDPLLPESENVNDIVEDPTEEELEAAITGNMGRLFAVAKAVKRFKRLLQRRRPELLDSILGRSSRLVAPPAALRHEYGIRQSQSQDVHDRRPLEGVLAAEGVHHELQTSDSGQVTPKQTHSPTHKNRSSLPPLKHAATAPEHDPSDDFRSPSTATPHTRLSSARTFSPDDHGRGHAHDPLEDKPYLNVGTGPTSPTLEPGQALLVCESPGGVEDGIYEKAYEEEMERILERRGKSASIYLTRRVEHKHDIRNREGVVGHVKAATGVDGGLAGILGRHHEGGKGGLMGVAQRLKEKRAEEDHDREDGDEKPDDDDAGEEEGDDGVVAKGVAA